MGPGRTQNAREGTASAVPARERLEPRSAVALGLPAYASASAAHGAAGHNAGMSTVPLAPSGAFPLIHIAFSRDPSGKRMALARGVIAIGDTAVGLVAIDGFAAGGVAIAGMGVWVISLAGISAAVLLVSAASLSEDSPSAVSPLGLSPPARFR